MVDDVVLGLEVNGLKVRVRDFVLVAAGNHIEHGCQICSETWQFTMSRVPLQAGPEA